MSDSVNPFPSLDLMLKLGEEKFNKFKSLMEKKKSGNKLTDDEKKELKLYMKELR